MFFRKVSTSSLSSNDGQQSAASIWPTSTTYSASTSSTTYSASTSSTTFSASISSATVFVRTETFCIISPCNSNWESEVNLLSLNLANYLRWSTARSFVSAQEIFKSVIFDLVMSFFAWQFWSVWSGKTLRFWCL